MNQIEKLQALLASEDSWHPTPIEILPNGEIREVGQHSASELKPGATPLTFRENLGGEYA